MHYITVGWLLWDKYFLQPVLPLHQRANMQLAKKKSSSKKTLTKLTAKAKAENLPWYKLATHAQ